MPIVSISQSVLFHKLQKKYTQEEFEELCFSYGLELDEVTTEKELVTREKGKEKSKGCSTEPVYKIEIPANRYDLLCPEGLSRALMIFESKTKPPVYITKKPQNPIQLHVSQSTQSVRPFVVAGILRNIALDEYKLNSFIDLQEKLHQNLCRKRSLVAIGAHDLDTLNPPFYYDTKPPNDIRFIALNKTKEHSAEELMELFSNDLHLKQYLPLIQDKPEYPVILDSSNVVLSMPPIINGEHSRISTKTRNIFIEATGTDLHKAIVVLDTLITMFSEYCKEPFTAEAVEVIQHDGSCCLYPHLEYRDEVVSVDYINRQLGTDFSEPQVINLLNRMGFTCASTSSNQFKDSTPNMLTAGQNTSGLISVKIPPTRHDILHACDIAEDVAIAFGYDNIPESLPQTYCVAGNQPVSRLTDLIRAEIAQMGFTEALSFSLCSREDISTRLRHKLDDIPAVHISNPKTLDFQVVRTSLLPGLLHTLSNNRSLPLPLKLFEVQDIVIKNPLKDVGATNHRRICAVYYNKNSGFEIIHGLLDRLMQLLQVESILTQATSQKFNDENNNKVKKSAMTYRLNATSDPTYFDGRCADIILEPGNRIIGRMGILHPEVIRNFELIMPCSALDLDLEVFL
uniref:Phenylalanine--tRNA ligase beta subunit n=1 Tax=Schistosoma japonicum TaxID=6182 RepID=Q5DGS2_SCHJA|nr:SJCHGC06626 protein [Schistosoma japonicum]